MKPYEVKNERKSEFSVDKIFLSRWSPRAMSGEKISKDELMSLFEAARWAPSSFNGQPWRFLYAMKVSEYWDLFFDLLVEGNKKWCKNAAALIVVISRKNFEHDEKPNRHHSFDSGAAWENLALQARMNNLVAHGMAGFDVEKARKVLEIPNDYNVEAMIAIGRQGKVEDLPKEIREWEKPNSRKHISEFVFEGKFNK